MLEQVFQKSLFRVEISDQGKAKRDHQTREEAYIQIIQHLHIGIFAMFRLWEEDKQQAGTQHNKQHYYTRQAINFHNFSFLFFSYDSPNKGKLKAII